MGGREKGGKSMGGEGGTGRPHLEQPRRYQIWRRLHPVSSNPNVGARPRCRCRHRHRFADVLLEILRRARREAEGREGRTAGKLPFGNRGQVKRRVRARTHARTHARAPLPPRPAPRAPPPPPLPPPSPSSLSLPPPPNTTFLPLLSPQTTFFTSVLSIPGIAREPRCSKSVTCNP
jgi:hypothetical protein